MREIKFRGKREDNGEWVFGSFVPDALEGSNSDLVSWGFIRRYNRDVGKMETIEVDRETVGQFTGLKDKNGNEIYEGDIVFIKGEDNKGTIVWDSEELEYGVDMEDVQVKLGCFYGRDLEVIGTIHDKAGDE